MTTPYNINANIYGTNGFGLPFCDTIYNATLAQNVDTTLTVPGSGYTKYIAVLSYEYDVDVWVAVNNVAAIPVGSTFALTKSELNPPAKYVKAGDVLHMFTPSASAAVSVAFYTIQD